MKKRKTEKRALSLLLVCLLALTGVGVMCYPFISNWYNQRLQDGLIEEYDHSVAVIDPAVLEAEREACVRYNQSLLGNVVLTDPFDAEAGKEASEAYQERLNLEGNSVMGYLEIPKINVRLAIYHGTDSKTLEKGVGHLENTSLPVGGTATHAVLSAHTAYATATLFNDLIDLEKGDIFYLNVLDETLAYQVDQIKVVEPADTSDLAIDRAEDQVTLVTCTPYGINSHRLLVRGTRIPYVEEEAEQVRTENRQSCPWYVILFIVLCVLALIMILVKRKRRHKAQHP